MESLSCINFCTGLMVSIFSLTYALHYLLTVLAALQHLGCILSTPKPESVPESSPLDMPQEDEDGQLLQLRVLHSRSSCSADS